MPPWVYYIVIALLVVGGGVGWYLYQRKRKSDDDDDHIMLSFVALLREPRYVEPAIIATAARNAWGAELVVARDDEDGLEDPDEDDADGFVASAGPSSLVLYQGKGMLVNTFPSPYVDEKEEAAETLADLRLRELFAEHNAWLSCDALGVESLDDRDEVNEWMRLLGRLLAELIDEDCLLIYIPHLDELYPNMEETWEMLQSENPIEMLQGKAPVPVLEIEGDDPRMVAAVEKARDTFHEFVTAFENRSGDQFGIKAPVTGGGNTEFIWVTVEAIENGTIYGRLANEPIDLGDYKIGSRVRIPVEELNDWVYLDTKDQPVGLHTMKVLAEAERERQDRNG